MGLSDERWPLFLVHVTPDDLDLARCPSPSAPHDGDVGLVGLCLQAVGLVALRFQEILCGDRGARRRRTNRNRARGRGYDKWRVHAGQKSLLIEPKWQRIIVFIKDYDDNDDDNDVLEPIPSKPKRFRA